jgi:hypothetical protein
MSKINENQEKVNIPLTFHDYKKQELNKDIFDNVDSLPKKVPN